MFQKNRFSILSSRKWLNYYPLQVVYEWEDILSKKLGIAIDSDSQNEVNTIFNRRHIQFIQKIIRNTFLRKYIDSSNNFFKRTQKDKYIVNFFLHPMPLANHYVYQDNSIVIFLDVWASNIDLLPKYCRNKLIFVTNVEILDYFKGHSISSKLRYIPLSISDKYYNEEIPHKIIDVLQIGRKNEVLHGWMLNLVSKHPHIEYVYSISLDGNNCYFSTQKGNLEVNTATREEFMNFLGGARISLLSSPGADQGEKLRTGGFNPVTPRFYESAVKYCYMVGRFPDTHDFIINSISDVCKRPSNYEEFESVILELVATEFNEKDKYDKFIKQHLTSNLADLVQFELEKL